MGKTILKIGMIALFLLSMSELALFAQENEAGEGAETESVFDETAKEDVFIARIKNAKDWQDAVRISEDAIARCKSYEDYEGLFRDVKRLIERFKDYEYPDVLRYACAKIRIEELSYLTKKNDIASGRIYMSVNEKYYNDALACLDKARESAKSKDLLIDIYFLRFLVFKELFQPEKVDAVFNEIINAIIGYSEDNAVNIAKLNEISQRLGDRGLADYALKLKVVYASKIDPAGAKTIADGIRASADQYFAENRAREAQATYDTYIGLAENYYDKETMASILMEIAERYFNKARYKEAVKYYSLYLFKYSDSRFADYSCYRLALALYNDKDYAKATAKFEEFLKTYQNSIWFEKGFEDLSRLYYENPSIEKAIESLRKLSDLYPRRDTRDYAELLIGILYYNAADYDKALDAFKKLQADFPRSAYIYAAGLLMQDIRDIKKGAAPSYSFGSKDLYKIWEPYTPISAGISAGEGAEVVESKAAGAEEIFVKAKSGAKITFSINGLEDTDRFSEFSQDKEDESRLPKKIRDQTEKDLLFFTWSNPEGGKFLDDKQTLTKAWKAPQEPGEYIMTVNIGDLGLIRPPDSGSKKDPAKTIIIHITVEK